MKVNSFAKIALLAAVAVSGAGYAQAQQPVKVGVAFQEMNNVYFITMKNALMNVAREKNVDLIFTDAHHDIMKQTNDVEDLIQQNIKILLLNPTDTVGIESSVKAAKAAGVIVIAVDANAKGPVDSFVGSKNEDAGRLACEYLAKSIGKSGDVAILDGIPVVPILQRVKGCREALANYPNIHITSVQNGRQERDVALTVTENILSANPRLKGIFSVNDVGSMGSLAAIKASGRDVKLTSVDGSPDACNAIKQPNSPFIATSAQFPGKMAVMALDLGLKKLSGQSIPSVVPVNVELIDRQAAATFKW
jgi:ribose transport system substrate-binding protein